MGFQFPLALLLLLLLPLLAWEYRRRFAKGSASGHVLFANLRELGQLSTTGRSRHWGAWLYLAALGLGIVGIARPYATIPAPDNLAGVMLAIDISLSMRANDIEPDRLTAAKKAAQNFVRNLPDGAKVGLVTFAGYATVEVPLTTNHQRIIDQIELLTMGRGTAIGEGLRESLGAFPVDDKNKPLGPSTVVLLSDGRNNRGADPLEVTPLAKQMGVVVHTIGLGRKSNPNQPNPSPDQFGGGFGGRWMMFDEETLQAIADSTGGKYYAAESAEALQEVYRKLNRVVGWKPMRSEVSGLTGALAGVLLASSLLLSNLRRRVV